MIQRVVAGVVVDDLKAAHDWYEQALGRPADANPMDGLFEWHFENGWLQVVELQKVREIQQLPAWGTAGATSVSLVVDDLDETLARLTAAGVGIGPRFTTPSVRTATLTDPAGNLVTLFEEL